MPTARWFEAGTVSPIVCTGGDPACTDFTATVTRHDDRVEWRLWDGRKVVFDGTAAATSLSDALND